MSPLNGSRIKCRRNRTSTQSIHKHPGHKIKCHLSGTSILQLVDGMSQSSIILLLCPKCELGNSITVSAKKQTKSWELSESLTRECININNSRCYIHTVAQKWAQRMEVKDGTGNSINLMTSRRQFRSHCRWHWPWGMAIRTSGSRLQCPLTTVGYRYNPQIKIE